MDKVIKSISERMKDIREFNDYSVSELANLAGIPENEYAEYEKGEKEIPIGKLYNIAAALTIDPTVLLTGNMSSQNEITLVYEGKGTKIERYPGYNFTSLAADFIGRKMEPMLVDLSAGIEPELVSHTGQEFNLILEGGIRLIVGEKEYYLRSGDTAYFNAELPHAQTAMTPTAKFLTVIMEH